MFGSSLLKVLLVYLFLCSEIHKALLTHYKGRTNFECNKLIQSHQNISEDGRHVDVSS